MLILGIVALATGLFLAVWLVVAPGGSRAVRQNLGRDAPAAPFGAVAGLGLPGGQSRLDAAIRRIMPPSAVRRMTTYVGSTGVATGRLDAALRAKVALGLLGAVLGVLLIVAMASPMGWVLAVIFTLGGWFAPDVIMRGRAEERRKAIDGALADTLDQLTIAVEAGLGFEAALMRITRNGEGPLAEELIRTLQDVQLGQSRKEAYRALGERAGVPDLSRFVRAIVQADAYGVPISSVLRTQSHEVRLKRRQRLEEQAMKIPVKVTFPLMVCLMPVLFIIVLTPAILNTMTLL